VVLEGIDLAMIKKTLAILLFLSAPAYSTIAFVAASNNLVTTSSAIVVTQTIPAGDLAIMFCAEGLNNTATMSMLDSTQGANTWTQTTSGYSRGSGSSRQSAMFYSYLASQITTATCVWSGSPSTTIRAVMLDVSGSASSSIEDVSIDSAAVATTTSMTSNSLTTTNANDILIFCADGSATCNPFTAGSNFTLNVNAQTVRDSCVYQVVSVTQSGLTTITTATTAVSNTNVFAGFKAAAAGGAAGANKARKLEMLEE
jgi:hypothetical protein